MAFTRNIDLNFIICTVLFFSALQLAEAGTPPEPFRGPALTPITMVNDTIPLEDRYGDFISDKSYNPFDILPSELDQQVEYDADTDSYIIYEKIGDEYFRTPSYMTFDEYLEWKNREAEKKYFEKLGGIGDAYKAKNGLGRLDPMSKIDIGKSLIDRLFGGNEITITPQGNIDLNFGARYTRAEDPQRQQDQQTQWYVPDFDMDIKMNVDGNIGDKMDLGFNYDTNASFDFDRKIKLAYDSEKWTDDDIIKKIEAGNVSLPLRSTLINGAQELFGIKTEAKFGHLTLTGIISQQRSKQENIQIQNGSTVQEFRLIPTEYDENRHFFVSHYHRDAFEGALSNMPYIQNSFRITNIEVWVTDDRPNFQSDQTTICAIADIAESEEARFSSRNNNSFSVDTDPIVVGNTTDQNDLRLPANQVNDLFSQLTEEPENLRSDVITTLLEQNYKLRPGVDYEKYRGKKLNSSEFYFNPELGFISLNVRLQPEQALSVSYEYFFTEKCEEVYKVGTTSDEVSLSNSNEMGERETEGVIITKMIKPSNESKTHATWDLMMKNVYPLRANNLEQNDFEFDIYYEDDSDGSLKKTLPFDGFTNIPLLNIFGLDNLNSRNDPQQDGIFDFVPGVTVVQQTSSIIFPVLEPFNTSLAETIDSLAPAGTPQSEIEAIKAALTFPTLYDDSPTKASQDLAQSKFVMAGKVKSSSTSEYSLGAWNIPRGSVRVTAGSFEMIEGVHYEIDYGIGRVRILDQSIIQQGVPVNISFEDNSIFSLQQKGMMGLRAEYEVDEDFYVGGTWLRLRERPFTQKVNYGDDPIQNSIFGLDMDINREVPFITKMVDKIPFYSTNEASSINFSAEVAALKPGHNKAINNKEDSGIVSLDDFEGAVSGFPLSSQPNRWVLASVPQDPDPNRFPESALTNDLAIGANRARLSWYVIDRFVGIDEGIKNTNPYTRRINQTDLFQRQIPQGQLPDLLTFDLSYFPSERGPYNYDTVEGYATSDGVERDETDNSTKLKNPESRWAGIMRYLNNTDFEAANYEFIEFWLLDPFDQRPDGSEQTTEIENGFLTFHLGSVSEDILKDSRQYFENSMPKDGEDVPLDQTVWGNVPKDVPLVDAFPGTGFSAQDLGLDGLDFGGESAQYDDWMTQLESIGVDDLRSDPSADDYVYFNDQSLGNTNNLIERYKFINNPEGNSPDVSQGNQNVFQRGNPIPDKEDLNNNRSLEAQEEYFEYKIPISSRTSMDSRSGFELDVDGNEFIRTTKTVSRASGDEKWYRFRIPLSDTTSVNGKSDFRSIQFIRLLVENFKSEKTFRMAEFELVRNQWFRDLATRQTPDGDGVTTFSVDVVGVEENSSDEPFGYLTPPGIVQERLVSSFAPINQDENSMVLKFEDLCRPVPTDSVQYCEASVLKLTDLDLRVFKKMQMFVHGEAAPEDEIVESGDLSVFIRVGKDFENHYYEYEIPLVLSDTSCLEEAAQCVWPLENKFDFNLDMFIQAKKLRNLTGAPIGEPYIIDGPMLAQLNIDPKYESIKDAPTPTEVAAATTLKSQRELMNKLYLPPGHKIRLVGNPNLGKVKGINVGVRNIDTESLPEGYSGEIWINELRLTGLQERGGVAGLARMDIQMADLGNVTASTSYSSIGWGALDQKVNERAKEEVIEYDVATNLQLGKFFPENWGVRLPFYGQYAKSIINPEFDAYDLDITVEDEFDLLQGKPREEFNEISNRNQTVNTIKTFNFTNVRKEKVAKKTRKRKNTKTNSSDTDKNDPVPPKPKKEKKNQPWSIENFSGTYAYTETQYRDPILEKNNSTDQTLGLDYTYSRKGGFITPFKKIKSKHLKILKEFNFSLLPTSFSVNSTINRYFSSRKYRIPDVPVLEFDDRRFNWERRYNLNWNLTKALKLNFDAYNESYIDEVRRTGVAETADDRDYVAFVRDANGFLENRVVNTEVDDIPDYVNDYWKENLKNGGRNTNYNHSFNVTYNLPIKYLPFLDWVDVRATYSSDFNWSAGALIKDSGGIPVGGVIQNGQDRGLTANLNFDKLYKKSKYVKSLDKMGKTKEKKKRRAKGTDKVSVTTDKDGKRTTKKKQRNASVAEKILLRPLFSLRKATFTLKEDFSTLVPGYTQTPNYFGLDDWNAPGVGFVLGVQPNLREYLPQAGADGWITRSSGLNEEVVQSRAQNFSAKFKFEPWRSFNITVDFKKNHRETHSEIFANPLESMDEEFKSQAARDMGSFDMTYFNMQTLFENDIDALFQKFLDYRPNISQRLGDSNTEHEIDGNDYTEGYGKASSSVIIPAFLAAYTDVNPDEVTLDLESVVSKRSYIPKPNWTLKYNGLTKIPWFAERFSSISIEHAYSSLLRVTSYATDVEYNDNDPFGKVRLNGNYFTRLEIPAVQISENFNPIIGVDIKTKNDFVLNFKYVKSRDLNLKINTSSQLEEDRKNNFVFGVGYTIKDSKFLKKNKKRTRTPRKTDEEKKKEEEDKRLKRGRNTVTSTRGSDMTFLLNIGFNDDRFFVHEIDKQKSVENNEVRGEKGLQINPTVEYNLNENITLIGNFDYNTNKPYGLANFRRTNVSGGITVRMNLQ